MEFKSIFFSISKTLTSFKVAKLATTLDFIDKVFFVVDRKDLDYQTMKEYQKIRKEQVESEFVDPYPDHDNTYMNEYYKDIRDEIVDKFNDSLDCMTREDIVGKEAIPGKNWKVVDGELVAVDNR